MSEAVKKIIEDIENLPKGTDLTELERVTEACVNKAKEIAPD